METTLLIHIVAGVLGLVAGFVALYASKGAMLHCGSMFYWLWRERFRRARGGILVLDGAQAVQS